MKISLHHILAMAIAIVVGIYFFIQPSSLDQGTTLEKIRLGVLPDESTESFHARYKPLLEHLSAKTGINCELVIPDDYKDLIRLFSEEKVEIAYFGGLTFLQANILNGAQPLVMRDIDARFTSFFIVKNQNKQELSEFKGKVFSFGNKLSTSGHLMPRHFLKTEHYINPEEFFTEVRYSGEHDTTAYQVRNGEVDIGVANAEIIIKMFEDGRLKKNDIHILSETQPYADNVWAVHAHLNEGIKTQLRNAFLALDLNNSAHDKILKNIGASFFLPAGINDFRSLKEIAETLGFFEVTKK